MKKKEIKAILHKCGYTIIPASWYRGKSKEKSVLFTAYDIDGRCYRWYVAWNNPKIYASKQLLSDVCVHEGSDASYIFN